MASIAANIVTKTAAAHAAGANAPAAKAGGDGFASILDALTAGATTDAQPTTLVQAQPGGDAAATPDAAADGAQDPDTAIPDTQTTGARLTRHLKQSDPAKVSDDDSGDDKSPTDAAAQLLAAAQAAAQPPAATGTEAPQAAPATQAAQATTDTSDDDAAALTELANAAPIASPALAGTLGAKPATAAKPDKTEKTADKASADSVAAKVLKAVGDAATRSFSDQHASAPAEAAKSAAQATAVAKPATAQQPASADATAVKPAEQPVPAPQQPQQSQQQQPAPTPAVAAATTVPNASPASAPAPLPSQIQIAHPAAAEPNLAALAVSIATKSEAGTKHFDIRLDPAELGRVDVRLTVDDSGKAQAALTVEKPQTLELLQKDQGQLQRALKDAGLDLAQNGLSFSLKGQQQQSGNGGNAQSSRARPLAVRALAAADQAASTLSLSSAPDARLDIRV